MNNLNCCLENSTHESIKRYANKSRSHWMKKKWDNRLFSVTKLEWEEKNAHNSMMRTAYRDFSTSFCHVNIPSAANTRLRRTHSELYTLGLYPFSSTLQKLPPLCAPRHSESSIVRTMHISGQRLDEQSSAGTQRLLFELKRSAPAANHQCVYIEASARIGWEEKTLYWVCPRTMSARGHAFRLKDSGRANAPNQGPCKTK